MEAPTNNLALPQFEELDDFSYQDVNTAFQSIDALTVPTVCTAGTRPDTNLFIGRTIWQTDTKQFYMWDGTKWLIAVNEFFKPMWRGYVTAAQTKASGATLGITIGEEFAKDGAFTQSGATYTRTIPMSGIYRLTGQVTWAAGTNGTRTVELKKNITGTDLSTGETLARGQEPPDGGSGLITCLATTMDDLVAGDKVTYGGLQTSGGNLDVIGTRYQSFFEIEWLRPL